MYVIPPEQSAEFVSNMEDVLEIYHRPYDPNRPVICMDDRYNWSKKPAFLYQPNRDSQRRMITNTNAMEQPISLCLQNPCLGGERQLSVSVEHRLTGQQKLRIYSTKTMLIATKSF